MRTDPIGAGTPQGGPFSIEDPVFLRQVEDTSNRVELWQRVIEASKVSVMAEIGVWKGEFAEAMLRASGALERYHMIDPWAHLADWNKPYNVADDVFVRVHEEALCRTRFAATRIVEHRGRTRDMASRIEDDTIDLVYVDGDHSLRGITVDLITMFDKVREGGLLGGDDFCEDPWQHGGNFEPTLIFPYVVYFAEAMNIPLVALPHGQFVMQKRSDCSFRFIDLTGRYSVRDLGSTCRPREPGHRQFVRWLKHLVAKCV